MTLKELIAQEEAKHGKQIGDEIALRIVEDHEEIYYEDCKNAEGKYDYYDLVDAEVKSYYYVDNYLMPKKMRLTVEVK